MCSRHTFLIGLLSLSIIGCDESTGPEIFGAEDATVDQRPASGDQSQSGDLALAFDQATPTPDQGPPTLDYGIVPALDNGTTPTPDQGQADDIGGSTGPAVPPTGNNPDALGSGASKTITIDGVNTEGEWGADTLLIRDPAADDARFLGGAWSAHEAPWDYAQLHAAWDETYLYIGIQYVNVTDVLDPSNLGSSEGSQIDGMDLIQFVAFDTDTRDGYSTGGDMWGKDKAFGGGSKPDYQLYIHSNFSQEGTYLSKYNPATRKLEQFTDGHATTELTGEAGEFYVGETLPGVNPDADNNRPGDYGSSRVDYIADGRNGLKHSTQYDTFFELKIPLTLLGLTKDSLKNSAIGIFAGNGDLSSVDSIPNDPATSDTPEVSDSNSPEEWADSDTFSVPFVLVGKR
ncbi:MAG: hypothetical protein JRH20_24990 [Deltaproteobacteria bacterium]|nr:hypothetical protein [Deltaproteobacteria bacterium]